MSSRRYSWVCILLTQWAPSMNARRSPAATSPCSHGRDPLPVSVVSVIVLPSCGSRLNRRPLSTHPITAIGVIPPRQRYEHPPPRPARRVYARADLHIARVAGYSTDRPIRLPPGHL